MNSILEFFQSQTSPILQALYAGLFTWIMTAIGAALVFLFKGSNRKVLDMALGFTGGVMIAASFWSLIAPAIDAVEVQNELGQSTLPSFLPPAIGFFIGALFMFILDKAIPHLHIFGKMKEAEGPKTDLKKTSLLVLAIAIHNIPEGLAVGVAFGALVIPEFANVYSLGAAVALGIGIGIQNFPEGFATFTATVYDPAIGVTLATAIAVHNIPEGIAVSVPIYYATKSKRKAFYISFLSGLAEPMGALIGFLIFRTVFNEALFGISFAFCAGIMVYVALNELLPVAKEYGEPSDTIIGVTIGMIIMAISLIMMYA